MLLSLNMFFWKCSAFSLSLRKDIKNQMSNEWISVLEQFFIFWTLEDRGEFTGNSEENTVRFLTMTENEKSILSTIRAGQIRPCIKI